MTKLYGDRWEIVKSLGEGGQAYTFLVRDLKGEGETLYVLKRLKNIKRIERFRREIEAIRNLSHENIVRLIDFEFESDRPFLITEYCSGGSLADSETFWQKSPSQALLLFLDICRGVHHVHIQTPRIIHRDLKPHNIFLRGQDGPAVVGDFGICWIDNDGERITLTEEVVGARSYTAPEIEGGRLDQISPNCDIYSLGKILYWLLSGKILSRENFRTQQNDLKKWNQHRSIWTNIYMEHINRLLDHMIVEDPTNRWNAEQVIILAEEAIELVSKEYVPIHKDIISKCKFCGQGFYRRQNTATGTDVHNFGITPVGSNEWMILVCDACGHVQLFRKDKAGRKEWWD